MAPSLGKDLFFQPGDVVTIQGESSEGIKATVLSVEPATKWIAGWNMPGYLPESEPAEFDDWQDAMTYLHDSIGRFWDEDASDGQHIRAAADAIWEALHIAAHDAIPGEEWSHVNGDTSLRFWVTRADDTDFNTAGS